MALIWAGLLSSPQIAFGHAQTGAPLQVQLGPVPSIKPSWRGRGAGGVACHRWGIHGSAGWLRQPFLAADQGGRIVAGIKRSLLAERPRPVAAGRL